MNLQRKKQREKESRAQEQQEAVDDDADEQAFYSMLKMFLFLHEKENGDVLNSGYDSDPPTLKDQEPDKKRNEK